MKKAEYKAEVFKNIKIQDQILKTWELCYEKKITEKEKQEIIKIIEDDYLKGRK